MKFASESQSLVVNGQLQTLAKTVKVIADDGGIYEIPRESIPAYVVLPKQGTRLQDVIVVMSKDGSELRRFSPNNMKTFAKFKKFIAVGEEGIPTTRTRQAKEIKTMRGGKTVRFTIPEAEVFDAVLELQAGEWEGLEVRMEIEYAFKSDSEGNAIVYGRTQSVMKKLYEFIRLCGVDPLTLTLKWRDNILPDLERALQEGDGMFMVTIAKGFVKEIEDAPVGILPNKKKAK